MLAVVESATLFGIDSLPIKVEINVATGVPAFTIVGLPDAAVQESRERVRHLTFRVRWPFLRRRSRFPSMDLRDVC